VVAGAVSNYWLAWWADNRFQQTTFWYMRRYAGISSHGCCSHSDTALYILLLILYTKIKGGVGVTLTSAPRHLPRAGRSSPGGCSHASDAALYTSLVILYNYTIYRAASE
jgi:hypothetical protein